MAALRPMLFRYLLGAMTQLDVTTTVRYHCIPEDLERLPQIVETWRKASQRMQELQECEGGIADEITAVEPPAELFGRLGEIEADPLFRASFSAVPISFKLVEIDKLIAPQREVNLDYIATLRRRLPGKALRDLIEFCLAPRVEPPPVRAIQTAPNQVTFSSPSVDLRFLGGFQKEMSEEDVRVAHEGGQPVRVITLLVGFGAAPISAWEVDRRFILHNGFHRVVALRAEGITQVPLVVQHAANPDIEFPDQLLNLSRKYLLEHQRPVLVKDFFDEALTLELRLNPRMKSVKVTWVEEDGIVPTD